MADFDNFTLNGWMTVKRRSAYSKYGDLTGSFSVNKPILKRDEVAFRVTFRVPRKAFIEQAMHVVVPVQEAAVYQPLAEVHDADDEENDNV